MCRSGIQGDWQHVGSDSAVLRLKIERHEVEGAPMAQLPCAQRQTRSLDQERCAWHDVTHADCGGASGVCQRTASSLVRLLLADERHIAIHDQSCTCMSRLARFPLAPFPPAPRLALPSVQAHTQAGRTQTATAPFREQCSFAQLYIFAMPSCLYALLGMFRGCSCCCS